MTELTRTDANRHLVERLRGGDQQALALLFAEYYGPLCLFVQRYVDDVAAAEDLVQNVFIRLWKHRTELNAETTLVAYLHAAARNAALNHLRNETRYQRRVAAARDEQDWQGSDMASDGSVYDPNVARDVRRAAVLQAAETLPPRCRDVFLLRWQQELTYAEIASVLEISVKTVEMQMTIAVKRIRLYVTKLLAQ